MILRFCPAILFILLLAGENALAGPGMQAFYGQSEYFWRFHEKIEAELTTDLMKREMIRDLRSNYELAFARAGVDSDIAFQNKENTDWPNRFNFVIEGEGAAAITSRGTASDEIRMARLYGGVFKGSFQGNLAEDLYFELGFALGAGDQKKVVIADNNGILSQGRSSGLTLLGGLDLKLQKIWRIGSTRLINTLQTEESYFKTLNEKLVGNVNWNLRNISHDWMFRTDYMFSQLNLHMIAAMHPYPTPLLPRSWNRVSSVSSSSRPLRSILGAGGGFTFFLGPAVQMAALGGYYAGMPGGEIRFRFAKTVGLKMSAYGVENSSEYRALTQRVYAAGLDVAL